MYTLLQCYCACWKCYVYSYTNNNNKKELWAKFTYYGKETRAITKPFKETQLRIAFKVNNTISLRLTPKLHNKDPQQQFERSGVYCITRPDCNRKYIGQTESHSKKDTKNTSMITNKTKGNLVSQPIYWIITTLWDRSMKSWPYYTQPEKADSWIR